LKSLINSKDFPRCLNGESGCASHLVYKFDKQIARCNNSQIKILNLYEFPHVLAAETDIKSVTANDILAEQNVSKG